MYVYGKYHVTFLYIPRLVSNFIGIIVAVAFFNVNDISKCFMQHEQCSNTFLSYYTCMYARGFLLFDRGIA